MNVTVKSIFQSKVGVSGLEIVRCLPRFIDLMKDGWPVDYRAIAEKTHYTESQVKYSVEQIRLAIFQLSTPDGERLNLRSMLRLEEELRA